MRRVHFVGGTCLVVIRNCISVVEKIGYQYITASSSSVSTCQLMNPRTLSSDGFRKTMNRVAGSRISAFLDCGDQPNDEFM